MLLVESLPEFSQELRQLLIAADEPGRAAQVDRLEIVAKCDCYLLCESSVPHPDAIEVGSLDIGSPRNKLSNLNISAVKIY